MHGRIQTSSIASKIQPPYVHRRHQTPCKKNEKELETLILSVRIYSQDIGMEFVIEKYAMLIMISVKQHRMEGIKLSHQDKIRTLREKENYKYLGILDADTIKKRRWEKKLKKNTSGERKNTRNQTTQQKSHQSPPRKIDGTIFKVDQIRTPTNGQANSWRCIRS